MQSLSPRWQQGSGCGSAVGRHSWVHTFPSNHGQGFPAAPHLSTGKAWQVKLEGEGCWNPVASDLLSSKQLFPVFSCSFTAAFPSLFLPHCTLQDEVSVCHMSPPPCHLLAPSSTFAGQKGCRAAEVQFVQGSGKAASKTGCCLFFHLAPPRPEDSLLPSLCWSQACPVVLHTLPEGPPGKGNGKKALRGSRRGAERDSSPFSFTLSFL